MMCQMFSIGERSGLQASQCSTWTPLLQCRAVGIAAVCGFALSCWNTQGLPWNRRRLEGSICCSKTFIYISAFIVPSKTCKLPIPYALMHTHTIRELLNWTLIKAFSSKVQKSSGFWNYSWAHLVMSDRIIPMSSEGPKSFTHRDVSSLCESFDNVMHCVWWDLQSLCNLALRNVVFKVFPNLFTHSFTDWRASAHLYFWKTLRHPFYS